MAEERKIKKIGKNHIHIQYSLINPFISLKEGRETYY